MGAGVPVIPGISAKTLREAAALLDTLKNAVVKTDDGMDLSRLTEKVCDLLQMPMLKENPLFQRTVACLREVA